MSNYVHLDSDVILPAIFVTATGLRAVARTVNAVTSDAPTNRALARQLSFAEMREGAHLTFHPDPACEARQSVFRGGRPRRSKTRTTSWR